MGNYSQADGAFGITPSIAVEPSSRFHPGNAESSALVRVVFDARGLAFELRPIAYELGKSRESALLADLVEFIDGCQESDLTGCIEYTSDYVEWRIAPRRRAKKRTNRGYLTYSGPASRMNGDPVPRSIKVSDTYW